MGALAVTDVPKLVPRGKFYRLLAAYFISSIGDWLYKLGLPLLVFQITGSAVQMAGTFALTFLPFILVSLFGGVIADRFPRKQVLILCDLAAALFLLVIAIAGGYLGSMPIIYIFVFLTASVAPIHHPSFQAFVPETVSTADLPKANSLISGSENLIAIIAPAMTGVVIAFLGPVQTILLNAASFALSAALVASIRVAERHKRSPSTQTIFETIREGFQYAWGHPVLKYGSLLFVGSNFAINIFQANLVFYLADILHAPTTIIGLVFGLTGVGAVIGAMIAPRVIEKFESGRIIVVSTILAGLFTFPLLVVKDPTAIGAIWAVETIFGTVNMITYFTLRQRAVPSEILGRAVATTRMISFSSIPVAALAGGIILQNMGITTVIVLCATIRLATGLLATLSPLASYKAPRMNNLP